MHDKGAFSPHRCRSLKNVTSQTVKQMGKNEFDMTRKAENLHPNILTLLSLYEAQAFNMHSKAIVGTH